MLPIYVNFSEYKVFYGGKMKRRNEISFFAIFLCFSVIFIHSASELISAGIGAASIYLPVMLIQRLFSFAVPGFVFLSGLRFMLTTKEKGKDFSAGRYILHRLYRIMPLYIIWTLIYFFFRIYSGVYSFSVIRLLRGFLSGDTEAHLYFVPLILQFCLIAPLSKKSHENIPACVSMVLSMLLTFIFGKNLSVLIEALFPGTPGFAYDDRVFTLYLVYWTAGCCVGNAYDKFRLFLMRFRLCVSCIFAFCFGLEIFAAYYTSVLKRYLPCFYEIHMLYSLAASMFFFMVAMLLSSEEKPLHAYLQRLDARTYFIYLSHVFPLLLLEFFVFSRHPFGLAEKMALRLAAVSAYTAVTALIPTIRLKRRAGTQKEKG